MSADDAIRAGAVPVFSPWWLVFRVWCDLRGLRRVAGTDGQVFEAGDGERFAFIVNQSSLPAVGCERLLVLESANPTFHVRDSDTAAVARVEGVEARALALGLRVKRVTVK